MEDRRTEPRTRALLNGTIVFNGRASSMNCAIRNISGTGVLVTVPAEAPMPETFDFRISSRAGEHHARLVWRRGGTAGVALEPAPPLVQSAAPRRPYLQGSPKRVNKGMSLGY